MAEVWRPDGADGPLPVVALIHGGFWRQLYTRRLMHPLAGAVVARGWIAYNIEYRRVGTFGRGGWPATFEDVSGALDALTEVTGADLRRVATCGHSAGGHLALWAGSARRTTQTAPPSHPVRVCTAVSLAGVVDLVAAARQMVGGTAVPALMGGDPDEVPDRYARGSPAELLPLGVPQLLVHGGADRSVPASLSAAYVERARAKGDDAFYLALPEYGHMEMIDPNRRALGEVLAHLEGVFRRETASGGS
ncbi:MAG TPA: alpha/beta hydrolase [Acidimicrobiales bacterium]